SGTHFGGPEPQPSAATGNGRPNAAPHAFTIELVVTSRHDGATLEGRDRRAAFLSRDRDLLPGFPRHVTPGAYTGDGESSPVLADLDGDNRNELVYATSDGYVHAIRPNGTELPGWPARGEVPSDNLGGAFLASVAVGDANGDGEPEVYAADLEGKVYGWSASGERI